MTRNFAAGMIFAIVLIWLLTREDRTPPEDRYIRVLKRPA
jgi:hypothetical protein